MNSSNSRKRLLGVGKLLKWAGLIGLTVLLVLLFKPIKETVSPIEPRASTEYWSMSGGYRIAYSAIRSKSPGENAIVYLHGGPGGYIHSSIIETLTPLARNGWDVYLYDQSGTGLSDRREFPKSTTYESHVADLEEIVDEKIRAKRLVVIGHSFGGQLAATFAARNPDRLSGLILSAPGGIEPTLFTEDGKWENAIAYPTPPEYAFVDASPTYVSDTSITRLPVRAIASVVIAQLFDRRFASDQELDAALNTMAAGFTHNMVCDPKNVQPEEGGGGAYGRIGTNFFPDGFDAGRISMPEMTAPVLVVQGQCDFIPFAAVYEYVDRFPNAKYEFIEGAGHIIWWDKPSAYRNAIESFLTEISP